MKNYCDRDGVLELKRTIEAYWAAKGHDVDVWLEHGSFLASIRGTREDVRSNMVGGMPKRTISRIRGGKR